MHFIIYDSKLADTIKRGTAALLSQYILNEVVKV
jgi:hypothetical protein